MEETAAEALKALESRLSRREFELRQARKELAQVKTWAVAGAIALTLVGGVGGGVVGFHRGQDKAWSLAGMRATRVWADGFCAGVGDGIVYTTAIVLGDTPSFVYLEYRENGWSDVSEQFGRIMRAGQSARYDDNIFGDGFVIDEFDQLLETTVAAAGIVKVADPYLEEDPEFHGGPPPALSSEDLDRDVYAPERYYGWLCDEVALEPDHVKDGLRSSNFTPVYDEPPDV